MVKKILRDFEFDPDNEFFRSLQKISDQDYLITRAKEEILTADNTNVFETLDKAIQLLILAKFKRLENG